MINEAIFREYDIRGLAESELSDPVVEHIAMAAAAVYVRDGKREIAMGMDGRPSSPRIKDLFIRTLTRYGLQVTDLGLVPTPVVYFATFRHKMDGAVIITASHNPTEYNGFKILLGNAALYGDQIKEIYHLACDGPLPGRKKRSDHAKKTSCPNTWPILKTTSRLKKKIRVVVDGGNGTGGITAPELYRRLGAEVTELYLRRGRPLSQPPPRPHRGEEPAGPDRQGEGDRRRPGHRPGRRRRPHRRRRRPGAHPLGRPAAGHLRPRHPQGPSRRHHHLRGQGLGGPLCRDQEVRRRAHHVEGRPFADQKEAFRSERPGSPARSAAISFSTTSGSASTTPSMPGRGCWRYSATPTPDPGRNLRLHPPGIQHARDPRRLPATTSSSASSTRSATITKSYCR